MKNKTMKKHIFASFLIIFSNILLAQVGSKVQSSIIGNWVNSEFGFEMKLSLQANGSGSFDGEKMTYSIAGSNLTIKESGITTTYKYQLNGNALTLSGGDLDAPITFSKGGASTQSVQPNYSNNNPTSPSQSGGYNQSQSNGGGVIDQSIVGKWCYVSSLNNPSATSSYSRCIVINGNGTYQYSEENSISGYGGGGYGGSNSQSADSGSWKVVGNAIHVQSRAEGFKIYSFEKRNHPRNGEPMIVIDGDPYVTYYQKAPWR
jgi:hypothetical protein